MSGYMRVAASRDMSPNVMTARRSSRADYLLMRRRVRWRLPAAQSGQF